MRERGTLATNAVIALAVLGALAAIAWGFKAWVAGLERDAREQGRQEIRLEVARRDNAQLRAAQAEIKRLTDLVRANEARHADELAKLDKEKTDEVAKIEARKDAFVSDVVAGRIRLFDPGRPSCPGGDQAPASAPVAAGGVGDGAGAAELSGQAAGFLSSEASRADKVAVIAAYLQRYAIEAQRLCNAGD